MASRQSLRERVQRKIDHQQRKLRGEPMLYEEPHEKPWLDPSLGKETAAIAEKLTRQNRRTHSGAFLAVVLSVIWGLIALAGVTFIVLGVVGLLWFGVRQLF
jgi:hypothetical protein